MLTRTKTVLVLILTVCFFAAILEVEFGHYENTFGDTYDCYLVQDQHQSEGICKSRGFLSTVHVATPSPLVNSIAWYLISIRVPGHPPTVQRRKVFLDHSILRI